MRVTTGLLAVTLMALGAPALADEKAGTDGEGFIQHGQPPVGFPNAPGSSPSALRPEANFAARPLRARSGQANREPCRGLEWIRGEFQAVEFWFPAQFGPPVS